MGHSQVEKAASRERILQEAAAQIRAGGLESLSLGPLMKRAGLTHGGFYGHFDSRADLLVQALARALDDGAAAARAGAASERRPGFADFVRRYLSRAHRAVPAAGCAIAALAGDVARADEAMRKVMAPRIESFIDTVREALGDTDDRRAIAAVSALVGALVLSRAMPDARRADEVLRAVRERLMAEDL